MSINTDPVTGQPTTGHEWDGITELDRPVSRPTLWAYGVTILFTIGAWILYPSLPYGTDYFRGLIGTTSRGVVLAELTTGQALRDDFLAEILERPLADLAADSAAKNRYFATAGVLFDDNCAACHGGDLRGQFGFPNLVDAAWLYPGTPENIEQTIRFGINAAHDDTRYGEMPAFGREELLARAELRQVAEFVVSLSGGSGGAHDAEIASLGAPIFAENCASCHGDDGAGLGQGAPDLTDNAWIYGGDVDAIIETLHQGRSGYMPAWEARLSDAEIRLLTLFILWQRSDA